MLLETIEAHDFRNLSGEVSWGTGLNIIYGDNGQGKTNWLEAIYFLATSKSFRTQRPQEAISFGKEMAIIRGRVAHSKEIHRDLQVAIQGNTKTLSVNNKRETVARYLGQISVVAFTADELDVIRGGPEARRKFLDKGIVSLHTSYIQTLSDYHRVIKQKKHLLHNILTGNIKLSDAFKLIEPWNEQLVPLSAAIHRKREDYVERLNHVLEKRLFGREEMIIRYRSSLRNKGDLKDYESIIRAHLHIRLEAEVQSASVLVGPHRDDLEILFDGRDMKVFGSSGQQRSALITLDLAVIKLYHSWHSEYPVFIMDDVDAELDRKRITKLLEYLEGRTQTFITTSKDEVVKEFSSHASIYEVADGGVSKQRYLT
jgi:DNA replication and repair protein RecF